MSVHDPLAARKPSHKPRRLGLYVPFLILLLVVLGWSAAWFWMRGQAEQRMDAAVADLGRAGYQISWDRRQIDGYPFRMDVTLTNARVRDPSGWGLETPRLEAESFAYALGHWMFAAPEGLTFVRPQAGPVRVTGRIIRASLTDFDRRPPSFDLQGEDLSFQPASGAEPFPLSAAQLVEFHLRAGPDDQGGVFVQVTKGKAQLGGLAGRIAGDKPVNLTWNSTLSKMSAFDGGDWGQAVRRWSDAGGLMDVRNTSQLVAGEALVQVRSGSLGVDHDGRLHGTLDVALRQAPQALGAMASAGMLPPTTASAASAVAAARQEGDTARASISFQAGQTTLGPVALGPAPRVYTPR
jgi:hypothetical protein